MDTDQVTPEVINWLKDAAEKGGAFVEREAPLFATEVVAWHFWSSVFFAVLCVIGFLLVIAFMVAVARADIPEASQEGAFVVFMFALILAVATAGGAIHNSYHAIKAAVAPRVVIVEYLTGAVR